MLSHIKDGKNQWTVMVGGKPAVFDESHQNYDALVEAVMDGKADEFNTLLNVGQSMVNWSEGKFFIKDGCLFYDGEEVDERLHDRIQEMIDGGYDYKPMLRFIERLYSNVSNRAVKEAYRWCQHKGLPITNDGFLVGYKGVSVYRGERHIDLLGREMTNGDYVDRYTGKSYRNNVGDINSMNRRNVCDDHLVGCSSGLHVGNYDYACGWAGSDGVVVLVKFDPADIVSVPSDSNYQKIRVSSYEVLEVTRGQLDDCVYDHEDEDDDLEDEDDEWL